MIYPVEVEYRAPNNLFVKYSDSLSGVVDLDEIINHPQYEPVRNQLELSNVSIAEDKDILIDGKIKLCKNATYAILKLKDQLNKLGLEL